MSVFKKRLSKQITGLLAVLLFVIGFIASGTPVVATQHGGDLESITLSPSSKRYQLDAGQVMTDEVTIINDGDVGYDFIVYARPYSVTNGSYDPNFNDTPSNADAYQWVQFDKTSFFLNPGENITVPYIIRVPENAAPGGHYGVIFAETQPPEATTSSVVRKKRVGSIIYATVNGTYTTGGRSLGSSISPLQFRPPLSATTSVENSGNADFEIVTTYTVTDLFGGVKYKEDKTFTILPQTNRTMTFAWQDAPWFGVFKAKINATYLDQTINDEGYVLLTPRWVLIVLALAVIGGGLYAALRRRR